MTKNILKLREYLLSLDLFDKNFMIRLLSTLNLSNETFVDFILMKSLLELKYIKCIKPVFLQDRLVHYYKNYIYKDYVFGTVKKFGYLNPSNKIRSKFFSVSYDFALTVMYLQKENIIKYCSDESLIILSFTKEISIKEAIIFNATEWPFLRREPYYFKNEYDNVLLYPSILNICKMHSIKYFLVKDIKIIETIKNVEKFFTNCFIYLENSYVKDSYLEDSYLEDWYTCYQYLTLIKDNVEYVYYSYDLYYNEIDKFKIKNKITFGLNPSSNDLSKVLINFGKSYLNEVSLLNLKKYICVSFGIDLDSFDTLMDINLDFTDDENIKALLCRYSLKSLILLVDWKENVLKNNYTEMLVELTCDDNLFKFFSIASNDSNFISHMNLLSKNKIYDIYPYMLSQLNNELSLLNSNWCKILNVDFIKCFFKALYSNVISFEYQLDILVDEYKSQYGLKNNFFNPDFQSKINLIIASQIIFEDKNIILDLETLILDTKCNDYKVQIFNYLGILNSLDKAITENLKKNFLLKVVNILNEIFRGFYPNLFKFLEKNNVLVLNENNSLLSSEYFLFDLRYYYTFLYINDINNELYREHFKPLTYDIVLSVVNYNHHISKFMDFFFTHKFIEDINVPFYFIGDSILCDINHVELIQNFVLEAYKKTYTSFYLSYYGDHSYIIYNLNSLHIYKI